MHRRGCLVYFAKLERNTFFKIPVFFKLPTFGSISGPNAGKMWPSSVQPGHIWTQSPVKVGVFGLLCVAFVPKVESCAHFFAHVDAFASSCLAPGLSGARWTASSPTKHRPDMNEG